MPSSLTKILFALHLMLTKIKITIIAFLTAYIFTYSSAKKVLKSNLNVSDGRNEKAWVGSF